MIRVACAIALGLLLAMCFALYYGVNGVKAQEARIRGLDASIEREREAVRVLRADWSFLNRPERLQELARRHLALGPTGASQIVVLAKLPERGGMTEVPSRTFEVSDLPERRAEHVDGEAPLAQREVAPR